MNERTCKAWLAITEVAYNIISIALFLTEADGGQSLYTNKIWMWSAWDLRHLWTIYSRIWLPEPQPVLTGSYWPILMDLVDLMDHHDPCKLNLERQSLQALDCWRKCSVLLRTSWEVLQLQIEKGGGERAEQTVWTTFTTHCPSSCHCRLATNRWTIICSLIHWLGVAHQYLGWAEWH